MQVTIHAGPDRTPSSGPSRRGIWGAETGGWHLTRQKLSIGTLCGAARLKLKRGLLLFKVSTRSPAPGIFCREPRFRRGKEFPHDGAPPLDRRNPRGGGAYNPRGGGAHRPVFPPRGCPLCDAIRRAPECL